jgi:hypothetical protein
MDDESLDISLLRAEVLAAANGDLEEVMTPAEAAREVLQLTPFFSRLSGPLCIAAAIRAGRTVGQARGCHAGCRVVRQ